ncbi:porin [Vreelandella sp. EE27]
MTTTKKLSLGMVFSALCTGQAMADNAHEGPQFSGLLTGGALKVEDRDVDVWAFRAEGGVGGNYTVNDGLRVRYDLIADFANAVNSVDDQTWAPGAHAQDNGEIFIRTARIVLLTEYGGFGIQPRVPSGFWHQIYNNIDTFEYNRLHGQTGQNAIFGQAEQGNNALTYGSPVFGGFQVIGAVLSTDAYNRRDADVVTGRLVYNKDALNFGVGHTRIDTPLGDSYDLYRTSLGVGYDFGAIQLGGVYEHNDDRVKTAERSFDAWGVNASTQLTPSWSMSLGYSENDKPNKVSNSAVTGIVRHHFSEEVYAFLEVANYDSTDDNVATGISITF